MRAEVRSFIPVERIEIVRGGEVVAVGENAAGGRDFVFETEIVVEESSWVAARTFSAEQLPYQAWDFVGTEGIPLLAHTSPIYIEVDSKPRRSPEDAAFLAEWCDRAIDWARNQARFAVEGQREEMIALFEKAKAVYVEQMQE